MKLTKADREALQLALDQTRAEPARAEQIANMLAEPRPWIEVAQFCAYHRQYDTLQLRPWMPTPCWVDDADTVLARPKRMLGTGVSDGWHEAATLVKRMQALGISRFHPDPMAAIADAKAKLPA